MTAAPTPTAWLAMVRDQFGVTHDTAVRAGGATGDDDGPSEPVISQRDTDQAAEKDYERWLDRDGRSAC